MSQPKGIGSSKRIRKIIQYLRTGQYPLSKKEERPSHQRDLKDLFQYAERLRAFHNAKRQAYPNPRIYELTRDDKRLIQAAITRGPWTKVQG
jgi:hypothetical protein